MWYPADKLKEFPRKYRPYNPWLEAVAVAVAVPEVAEYDLLPISKPTIHSFPKKAPTVNGGAKIVAPWIPTGVRPSNTVDLSRLPAESADAEVARNRVLAAMMSFLHKVIAFL